jgi:hypothetical protein
MYKVGDVVRFKDEKILNQLQNEGKVNCGWNILSMNYLCGQTRIITEELLNEIKTMEPWCGNFPLWKEIDKNGIQWYVSQDMIELVS